MFPELTNSKMNKFDCLVTIQRSGSLGARYEFSERSWCSVGSHQDCDIRILSNGVALLHALITITDGEEPLIYGLDETLPVLIPERDISLCNSMFATLLHGDVFFAGERAFRFERANGPPLPAPDVPASASPSSEIPQSEPVQELVIPRSTRSRRKSRKSRKSMVVSDLKETFVDMPESGPLIRKTRFSMAAGEIAAQLIKDGDLASPTPFQDLHPAARSRKSMPVFSGAFGKISVTYEQPVDAEQKLVRDRLNLMSTRKKKKKNSTVRIKPEEIQVAAVDENEPPVAPKTFKTLPKQENQPIDVDSFYAGTPLKTPQRVPKMRTPKTRKSKSAAKTLKFDDGLSKITEKHDKTQGNHPADIDSFYAGTPLKTPQRVPKMQTPKARKSKSAAKTHASMTDDPDHTESGLSEMTEKYGKTPVRTTLQFEKESMVVEQDPKTPARVTVPLSKTPLRKATQANVPSTPTPLSASLVDVSKTPLAGRLSRAGHITPLFEACLATPTIAQALVPESPAKLSKIVAPHATDTGIESDAEMTEDDAGLAFASPKKPELEPMPESPGLKCEVEPLFATPRKTPKRGGLFSSVQPPRTPFSARRNPRPPTSATANRLTPRRHPEVVLRGLATPLRTSSTIGTPSRLGAYATPRRTAGGPAIKKPRLPPRTPKRERPDVDDDIFIGTPRSAIRPPLRLSKRMAPESPQVGPPLRYPQATDSPLVGPPRRASQVSRTSLSSNKAGGEVGPARRPSMAQRLSAAAGLKIETPARKPGPPMRFSAAQQEAREAALTPKIRPAQRLSQVAEPEKPIRAVNVFGFNAEDGASSRRTAVTPTSGAVTAEKMRARRSARSNKTMLRTPSVDVYASKLPTLKSPSARSPSPAKPSVNQFVAKTPGARLAFPVLTFSPRGRSPRLAKSPTFKATVQSPAAQSTPFAEVSKLPEDAGLDKSAVIMIEKAAAVVQEPEKVTTNENLESMKLVDESTIAATITEAAEYESDVAPESTCNQNEFEPTKDDLFKPSLEEAGSIEEKDNVDITPVKQTAAPKADEESEPETPVQNMGLSATKPADDDTSIVRVVEARSPVESVRPRDMPDLCSTRQAEAQYLSAMRTPRSTRPSLGVASRTISKTPHNPRTPSKVAFSGVELEEGPHYSPRARVDRPLLFPPTSDNDTPHRHPAEAVREQRVVPGEAPSSALARLGQFFFKSSPPKEEQKQPDEESSEDEDYTPERDEEESSVLSLSSGSAMSLGSSNKYDSDEFESEEESEDEPEPESGNGQTSLSTDHTPRRLSLGERLSALFYGAPNVPERPPTSTHQSTPSDCAPTRTSASSEPAPEVETVPEPVGEEDEEVVIKEYKTAEVTVEEEESDEEVVEVEDDEEVVEVEDDEELVEVNDDEEVVEVDEEVVEVDEEVEDSDDDVEVSPPRRRSLIGRAISAVVLAAVSPARTLSRLYSGQKTSEESPMEIDDASSDSAPGDTGLDADDSSPLSEPAVPSDVTPMQEPMSDAKSATVTPLQSPAHETIATASNLLSRFNDDETENLIDSAPLTGQNGTTPRDNIIESTLEIAKVNSDTNQKDTVIAMEHEKVDMNADEPPVDNTNIVTDMDVVEQETVDDALKDKEQRKSEASDAEEEGDVVNTDTVKSPAPQIAEALSKMKVVVSEPESEEEQEVDEADAASDNEKTEEPSSPRVAFKEPVSEVRNLPTDYSKWTVKDLREYLHGLDITLGKGMKKADLILAAQKADGSYVEPEPEEDVSQPESDDEPTKQESDAESDANEQMSDGSSTPAPEIDGDRKEELRALLLGRKVPYLRGLLRKCDIDVKGRKADLVETLLAESFDKVMAFIEEDESAPAVPENPESLRSARKKQPSPIKQPEKTPEVENEDQSSEEDEAIEDSGSGAESRRTELKSLTVKKLQVLLGKLKLDKTGRKDALVERIIEAEHGDNKEVEEEEEEPATPTPKPASRAARATRSTVKKAPKDSGDVSRMTVSQLRKYLRSQGRCTNGLKSALVLRAEDEQAGPRRRRKFKDDYLCAGCTDDDTCVGPK